jgi:predicted transcriptional regulator
MKIKNLMNRGMSSVLICLNQKTETYTAKISKETDITYAHTVTILQELEKNGLVIAEKRGRERRVRLTEKGREIAKAVEKMKKLLEKHENGEKQIADNQSQVQQVRT